MVGGDRSWAGKHWEGPQMGSRHPPCSRSALWRDGAPSQREHESFSSSTVASLAGWKEAVVCPPDGGRAPGIGIVRVLRRSCRSMLDGMDEGGGWSLDGETWSRKSTRARCADRNYKRTVCFAQADSARLKQFHDEKIREKIKGDINVYGTGTWREGLMSTVQVKIVACAGVGGKASRYHKILPSTTFLQNYGSVATQEKLLRALHWTDGELGSPQLPAPATAWDPLRAGRCGGARGGIGELETIWFCERGNKSERHNAKAFRPLRAPVIGGPHQGSALSTHQL